MNFKFTKVKTISSIIISALFGILISIQGIIFGGINSDWQVPKIITFLFGFIIAFIFIYLVWSLFENRKNESKLSKITSIILRILILLGVVYLIFYLQTTIFY